MASIYNNSKEFNDYFIDTLCLEETHRDYETEERYIKIPDNTTYTYVGAFECLESLKLIIFPNCIKSIKSHSFFECVNLRFVNLPNSVISIENNAFMKCYNLETIVLSNSIKLIEVGAFSDCYNLKSIYIPNSIEILDEYVFANCIGIKSITISKIFENRLNEIFFKVDLSKVNITYT
jgi:hypothetical protein